MNTRDLISTYIQRKIAVGTQPIKLEQNRPYIITHYNNKLKIMRMTVFNINANQNNDP